MYHVTRLCLCVAVAAAVTFARGSVLEVTPRPDQPWEDIGGTARPAAFAVRMPAAPTLDGRTDDAAWRSIDPLGSFAQVRGVPADAVQWVTLRLGFTDEALYIAAALANPSDRLRATVRESYGRVWRDD